MGFIPDSSNTSNGLISPTTVTNTYLRSLYDVGISNVQNNQLLSYDSTTQKWVNSTPATVTTSLSALTDCSVGSLVNNNVLYYNSTNSKWENKALQESYLTSLSTDLSACEKTSNKNISSGYCGLDVNSLVSVSNLPSISESKVINLTTDLSACEKT